MPEVPIIQEPSSSSDDTSQQTPPRQSSEKQLTSLRSSNISSYQNISSQGNLIKSKSNSHLGSSIFSSPRLNRLTYGAESNMMLQEDAIWSDLKMKVLPLFNGEGLKGAIEELNEQTQSPSSLVDKVQDLIKTGISTLKPDVKLTRMVENWSFFYGTVLPYFQGVFLPLEQELRGQFENVSVRKLILRGYRDNFVLVNLDKIVEATTKALNDPEGYKTPDTIGRIFQMLTVLLEIKDENQAKLEVALDSLE